MGQRETERVGRQWERECVCERETERERERQRERQREREREREREKTILAIISWHKQV